MCVCVPFDLAGDETVGDVVDAGAAVAVDGGAQHAELAHLVEDLAVELLVTVGEGDAGQQLLLAVVGHLVADGTLLLGELGLEVERISPVEGHFLCWRTNE